MNTDLPTWLPEDEDITWFVSRDLDDEPVYDLPWDPEPART
jgi:hypothetical protein